ncbi:hypothetical protein [Anaerosolibacter sp.]|uniref:hypothetical protein n=1 Tax=Anaerosolibacter sp. TaxID=1872527 RepID=UPI0039EF7F88
MNIEENECKQGVYEYIQLAIDNLEKAMNVIECDERFNDGQSEKINEMYDKIRVQILKIKSI